MQEEGPTTTTGEPIAPFWRRLPFIFRFPFRAEPLVVLAGITGVSALAGMMLGTTGLLLKGLLAFAGMRYGFRLLELFSEGQFDAAAAFHPLWGGKERRPLKFALVLAVFISIAVSFGSDNLPDALASDPLLHPQPGDPLWINSQPAAYWLLVLAASVGLPSAALVIAQENRFFKALNPLHALRFMRAMGGAYFLLWALFIAIAGCRQVVLEVGETLPPAISFPLEMALATYLSMVLFALMGYALFQFRDELARR